MQEKASQSPWDGGDTEGGNGRRATGHCIFVCIRGVRGSPEALSWQKGEHGVQENTVLSCTESI